ncbi:ferric reductase [uncultured Roseobacter sp.]|uniref:ferric reductase n=1 Tax=uncultured Roseobacter sp. TaxID=114847 RepID=UPI0026304A7F|nr:ferric reductase [uncultured Roseobacter sp.]
MTGRAILAWAAITFIVGVPIAIAAGSPLLEWRDPIYIVGGFGGIVGLGLLLLQPLLIGGALVKRPVAGRVHVWVGIALVVAVTLHVVGLWITSPPDVIDVLLFRSATPFGIWGAVAMWSAFGAAICAGFRHQLGPRAFRAGHAFLTTLTIVGTVLHALMIEGTMGQLSKTVLCIFVLAATVWSIWERKSLRGILSVKVLKPKTDRSR